MELTPGCLLVRVNVTSGANFPTGFFGGCSPWLQVNLGHKQRAATQVVSTKSNPNPEWNRTFLFVAENADQSMKIDVMSKGVCSETSLGTCIIQLRGLALQVTQPVMVSLEKGGSKKRGTPVVNLTVTVYPPPGGDVSASTTTPSAAPMVVELTPSAPPMPAELEAQMFPAAQPFQLPDQGVPQGHTIYPAYPPSAYPTAYPQPSQGYVPTAYPAPPSAYPAPPAESFGYVAHVGGISSPAPPSTTVHH